MANDVHSLGDFLTTIGKHSVRTTNMFEMTINTRYKAVADALKDITIYGQGFELPNRTTEFVDVSFKGYPVPIPTLTKMGNEHSITVNADTEGNLRRAFLLWQACASNPNKDGYFEGNKRLAGLESEVIRIKLLSEDMVHPSDTICIYGVRIADVGTQQVSNTEASVATFTVSFRSVYWEYDPSISKSGLALTTAGVSVTRGPIK